MAMRIPARSNLGLVALALAGWACGGVHLGGGSRADSRSVQSQRAEAPGDPAHNLLRNMDFATNSMLPWQSVFAGTADGTAAVKNGALCVAVTAPGTARSDAQLRHREMVLQKSHDYVVSFKAWATREVTLATRIGGALSPNTDYFTKELALSKEPEQFSYQFKMTHDDDPTAEFVMSFGGPALKEAGPVEVCFDDVVLSDPQFTPPAVAKKANVPRIRVNQTGYVPTFAKWATLVTDAKMPLEFSVVAASGKIAYTGKTTVQNPDVSAGDNLQQLDFSSVTTPGKGYVIKIGAETSDPFDIDISIYRSAKYHAFRYFYLNRSGVELKLPFTRKSEWARPAGQATDEVTCPANQCNYSLDVSGGWYDAGDYGKYVVNGGFSAWMLMNWYERTNAVGGDASAFGDLKEVLPESGNKVPDILDEARWEVEFLLRMQVPAGQPNAGMVHHKVHATDWLGLGVGPHESQLKRELHPVSTAATLNLAAVAAQAARLFTKFDPDFAGRCRNAAEIAWSAAKLNPTQLAPADDDKGGAAYDDTDVTDETYWAAAELWLLTGKRDYRVAVESSPLDKSVNATTDGAPMLMNWRRVDALGKISMALATHRGAAQERERYRQQIVNAADSYAKLTQTAGYRQPFSTNKTGEYPTASNFAIANNSVILALAYDFAKQQRYRDAAVSGVDYLLGRNAMGQSYVTGMGERPVQNPHHRFWAHQANPKYPSPPPGVLASGPSSILIDPYVVAAKLPGCKPQKCFVDHIEAWSVNEPSISGNASLMWMLAWTDEQAH
jgi:endoglucanase